MKIFLNDLGQPVGECLGGWQGAALPVRRCLTGKFCGVEPLCVDTHSESLFAALSEDTSGRTWTYMRYGPFSSLGAFVEWMEDYCFSADPFFYAFVEKNTGRALGMATYCSISPSHGSIEVGHVNFAPSMQRTAMATEAMYLMARHAFRVLHYRRYEWRLDNLNAASHEAAKRLGFVYEGVFRNASNYKGRNRDTAWYSITHSEWDDLEIAFESWLDHLDPVSGKQQKSLGEFIKTAVR
ncbi:MAG: GNAT family protein [Parasphingorhabdus sp.]